MTTRKNSAEIRARLAHPVIDSDGHSIDFKHLIVHYINDIGGKDLADSYAACTQFVNFGPAWYEAGPERRLAKRLPRPAWWGHPAGNAMDLATAQLPRLLHERLPESGIDVTVLYAGNGFLEGLINDGELRTATCRANNLLHMDLYRPYQDRIIPVATIPSHTPDEAIAELEYCVRELGYRAFVMSSYVKRPIPEYRSEFPRTFWFDTYGIDSAYDYDPFWQKCLELKISPTFHSPTQGMHFKASISNFTYNHIGHFAQSAEAVCKSLLMGGVSRRFPELNFAFLEGGAGWAANLFNDFVGHWKKRRIEALALVNPAKLNHAEYFELCQNYGSEILGDMLSPSKRNRLLSLLGTDFQEDPRMVDEFAKMRMTSVEDLHALFLKPFFFGCEGDDPMTSIAFNPKCNALNGKLNAIFGSDIGHFDVPEIAEVLEETWEPVEEGRMTEEDFRDFVFANPIRMWTRQNPDFFSGTAVEADVRGYLAAQ